MIDDAVACLDLDGLRPRPARDDAAKMALALENVLDSLALPLSAAPDDPAGDSVVLCEAGTASLAVFLICTVLVMHQERPAEESQYLTQILNARVDPVVSPNATVSIFEVKQDRVTVLWTEGLQSLPADYAAK